jgi:hypothetical protein
MEEGTLIMLKKTLIATATAGLIAAGGLATATGASAAPVTGAIHVGIATAGYHAPWFRPHRVCQPVFKRVSYWYHGHRHSRVIKTGVRCRWGNPQWHAGGPWHHPGRDHHPGPGPHPGPHSGGPYPHH